METQISRQVGDELRYGGKISASCWAFREDGDRPPEVWASVDRPDGSGFRFLWTMTPDMTRRFADALREVADWAVSNVKGQGVAS